MSTKVKIEFYKDTGKWYTTLQFNTNEDVWDTEKLIQAGRRTHGFVKDMPFTIEATCRKTMALNKRMVWPTIIPPVSTESEPK